MCRCRGGGSIPCRCRWSRWFLQYIAVCGYCGYKNKNNNSGTLHEVRTCVLWCHGGKQPPCSGGRWLGRKHTRLASVESIRVDSTTGQCRDRQWKVMKATLSTARSGLAVTAMGDCAIVLGGYGSGDRLSSVEVVDTQHDTAWTLPNHNMTDRRNGCAAVTLRDGRVLVTGGHDGSNFLGSAELLQFQVRCIPTVTVVRQGSGVKSGRETALEHWFR